LILAKRPRSDVEISSATNVDGTRHGESTSVTQKVVTRYTLPCTVNSKKDKNLDE